MMSAYDVYDLLDAVNNVDLQTLDPGRKLRPAVVIRRIVILAVIALFLIPLPFRRTVQAVEIDQGSGEATLREIEIRGWYSINLLRPDRFRGTIRIDGHPLTELPIINGIDVKLSVESPVDYDWKAVCERLPELESMKDERGMIWNFSLISSRPWFGRFVINVYDHEIADGKVTAHFSGAEGTVIVGGFTDSEAAQRWLKEVRSW